MQMRRILNETEKELDKIAKIIWKKYHVFAILKDANFHKLYMENKDIMSYEEMAQKFYEDYLKNN